MIAIQFPRLATLATGTLLVAAVATLPLGEQTPGEPAPPLAPGSLPGSWRAVANGDRIAALRREGQTAWAATEGGGVVRWDLATGTYRQFLAPQDGLPSNDVRSLLRDSKGRLWAATSRGLARYDGHADRWLAWPMPAEFSSVSVTALAQAPDGSLWVGFEQRWDYTAPGPLPGEKGAFVGGGLARLDPDSGTWGPVWRAEPAQGGESYATIPSDNVTALVVAPDGTLWVGTRPYMAWLAERRGPGGQWLQQGGGLAATDGQRWRQWLPTGAADLCLAAHITSLAADAAGRVWVGTAGRGLQVFRASLATRPCDGRGGHNYYTRPRGTSSPGLPDNFVWALAVGADGRVWAGVGRGRDRGLGIAVFDHQGTFEGQAGPGQTDDLWTILGLEGRLGATDALVSALVVGGQDGGGAGGAGESAGRGGKGNEAAGATEAEELLAGTRDERGGDGWGIKRLAGGVWTTLATADTGLPSNHITALAVQPTTGQVWLGTAHRGLARWDGRQWRHWRAFGRGRQVARVVADAPAGAERVTISLDGPGFAGLFPGSLPMIRLGDDPTPYLISASQSTSDGVRLQLQPKLELPHPAGEPVFTVERGPPSDAVSAIAFDGAGRVWVGGRQTSWLGNLCPPDRAARGACWLDGGVAVFDGRGWTVFDETNGMPHGDVQAVAVDAAGRLWAGTGDQGDGYAVYDPATGGWSVPGRGQSQRPRAVAGLAVDPAAGHVWTANTRRTVCEPPGGDCTRQVGGGVARWDGGAWTGWSLSEGAPLLAVGKDGDFIRIVVDGRRGGVWAGGWGEDPAGFHWTSGRGIRTALAWCPGECASGGWQAIDLGDDGPVTALATDEKGRLWVGATRFRNGGLRQRAGLRLLSGQHWFTVSADHSPLPDDNVTALASYGATVWIGTLDRGVAVWREMTPVDYLYLPVVHQLRAGRAR